MSVIVPPSRTAGKFVKIPSIQVPDGLVRCTYCKDKDRFYLAATDLPVFTPSAPETADPQWYSPDKYGIRVKHKIPFYAAAKRLLSFDVQTVADVLRDTGYPKIAGMLVDDILPKMRTYLESGEVTWQGAAGAESPVFDGGKRPVAETQEKSFREVFDEAVASEEEVTVKESAEICWFRKVRAVMAGGVPEFGVLSPAVTAYANATGSISVPRFCDVVNGITGCDFTPFSLMKALTEKGCVSETDPFAGKAYDDRLLVIAGGAKPSFSSKEEFDRAVETCVSVTAEGQVRFIRALVDDRRDGRI